MNFLKNIFFSTAVFLLTYSTALAQGDSGVGGDISLRDPLSGSDIENILERIINFLLIIAAPVAVIMAIWAGYLFMTAGGNEEKVKTARKTLMYVVIGVAVLILSKGVISLVVSFLQ